jgi:hypothetical protein
MKADCQHNVITLNKTDRLERKRSQDLSRYSPPAANAELTAKPCRCNLRLQIIRYLSSSECARRDSSVV